jgi:hypothetical protein
VKVRSLTIGASGARRGGATARRRRARRPRRQVILRWSLIITVLLVLSGGAVWLLTSPVFGVVRVESGRYRYSSQDAVQTALSRVLGRNIWRLSHGDVSAACADLPWVRDIRLQRRLPSTVMVELVEWRPLLGVARPEDADGSWVLLADGRVLEAPPHLEVPGLPVLVGADVIIDDAGHQRLASPVDDVVLGLLRALEETGLESATPVDFVRITPDGYVVELQRRAGSLLLGHGDFAGRLSRYLLARDSIPFGASVDLRFADRITFVPPGQDRT